jgi:branched-chain amino acid transport system substrate-binding protein
MRANRVAQRSAPLLLALLLIGSTGTAAGTAGRARPPATCARVQLGLMAPLRGELAFPGQEALSWSRFALARFNRRFRTRITIDPQDTGLSADLARIAGHQLVATPSVYGVIGPLASQSVVLAGPLFARAHLAAVSGSATRVDLTSGEYPTFFRVIANDGAQAPAIVRYITTNLRAKRVTVMDAEDAYSTPLAIAIARRLRNRGVAVDERSTVAGAGDFSAIATATPDDTDVVVFATQLAADANTLATALQVAGKRAIVFGTDGAFSPALFRPAHGFVTSVVGDLHLDHSRRSLVAAYARFSHDRPFSAFGPPAYEATWVLASAIHAACADGTISRAEVLARVRTTNAPSILGGRVKFTPHGDVRGATFHIFEIANGNYHAVRS